MDGYTKLASSIVGSTVWQESAETCKVWITMLAMANKHGEVMASVPGLAGFARVSLKATEAALERFMAPDRYSRTKDRDGRRIEEIDGGWRLLNYEKYRRFMSTEDRQEKDRERNKRRPSYVYYAGVGDTVKIGFSANPWSRVREFRTTHPAIRLIAVEDGTLQLERQRHERFDPFHIDREWFRYEGELRSFVEQIVATTVDGVAATTTTIATVATVTDKQKQRADTKAEAIKIQEPGISVIEAAKAVSIELRVAGEKHLSMLRDVINNEITAHPTWKPETIAESLIETRRNYEELPQVRSPSPGFFVWPTPAFFSSGIWRQPEIWLNGAKLAMEAKVGGR